MPFPTIYGPQLAPLVSLPLCCADLHKRGVISGSCCLSCHDDEDYGWCELEEYTLTTGEIVRVCCDSARELKEKGLFYE